MRNQLTQDSPTLFIDQYGDKLTASSAKELRAKAGGGRVSRQYQDRKDGSPLWTGYVVGCRWFTAFKRCEVSGGI